MKSRHVLFVMWLFMTAAFIFSLSTHAQQLILKENTFIEIVDSVRNSGYFYQTKDGKIYPILLSPKGNAYIIVTSKKGNQYRRYLPKLKNKLSKSITSNGKKSNSIGDSKLTICYRNNTDTRIYIQKTHKNV